MSGHESTGSAPGLPDSSVSDDGKYIVRDPRQIRMLIQALVDQRAMLSVHPDGRGQFFPSAVLEVDDGGLLLDGSRLSSVNRSVAEAGFLLCFAQVDRVEVRFRVERPRRQEEDGYVAFRTALPGELRHLQRREFYRLETPVADPLWCRFPDPDGGEPLRWRVADISAGGMAVLLPPGQEHVLELQQCYPGCVLELPKGTAITLTLVVRNLVTRTRTDGTEQLRAGLRFEDLPRGADALIQRHIFRIERKRIARLSGHA